MLIDSIVLGSLVWSLVIGGETEFWEYLKGRPTADINCAKIKFSVETPLALVPDGDNRIMMLTKSFMVYHGEIKDDVALSWNEKVLKINFTTVRGQPMQSLSEWSELYKLLIVGGEKRDVKKNFRNSLKIETGETDQQQQTFLFGFGFETLKFNRTTNHINWIYLFGLDFSWEHGIPLSSVIQNEFYYFDKRDDHLKLSQFRYQREGFFDKVTKIEEGTRSICDSDENRKSARGIKNIQSQCPTPFKMKPDYGFITDQNVYLVQKDEQVMIFSIKVLQDSGQQYQTSMIRTSEFIQCFGDHPKLMKESIVKNKSNNDLVWLLVFISSIGVLLFVFGKTLHRRKLSREKNLEPSNAEEEEDFRRKTSLLPLLNRRTIKSDKKINRYMKPWKKPVKSRRIKINVKNLRDQTNKTIDVYG